MKTRTPSSPSSGAEEERIIPATVTIAKQDAETSAPLAGAVFDVRYSSADNSVYDEDPRDLYDDGIGRLAGGQRRLSLLPGDYEIEEVSAPPNYYLDASTAVQNVTLTPGEAGTVTFSDFLLAACS